MEDERTSEPAPNVRDVAFAYVGFWRRVLANLIDIVIVCVVNVPLTLAVYGPEYFTRDAPTEFPAMLAVGPADFIISWVLPSLYTVGFWYLKQATPGKMVVSARIVDVRSGARLSLLQCLGRYIASFVSLLAFGLGVFWIAFDKRKQGWHDKIASTLVVKT